MSIVRKVMVRLLGSRSQRIHSEFGEVIVRTTKELGRSDTDESIKSLLIGWLVSLPWAYFEALFINDEPWNRSLSAVLDNAQVINGEDCALISQAFCLWHLEQLTRNDSGYKDYSIKGIEQLIRGQMTKGILITEKWEKFGKILPDTHPDDWYFEYINEVLDALYTDRKRKSSIIDSLRFDSRLRLALLTISVEMIVTTKRIRSQQ